MWQSNLLKVIDKFQKALSALSFNLFIWFVEKKTFGKNMYGKEGHLAQSFISLFSRPPSTPFDTLYATYLDWDPQFRLFNTAR